MKAIRPHKSSLQNIVIFLPHFHKKFVLLLLIVYPFTSLIASVNAATNTSSAPRLANSAAPRSESLMDNGQASIKGFEYVITPERRALLNTIRFAEGTWLKGSDLGYRVMFGGSLMPSLDRHPNRVIYSNRYASAAAGAYQFMPFTWNFVRNKLGLSGFGPDQQDQGALFLVQYRKALPLADKGEMSPKLAAKLSPEWASFPTLRGNSYYGQPVKSFDRLNSFHKVELAKLRQLRDQRRELLMKENSL